MALTLLLMIFFKLFILTNLQLTIRLSNLETVYCIFFTIKFMFLQYNLQYFIQSGNTLVQVSIHTKISKAALTPFSSKIHN